MLRLLLFSVCFFFLSSSFEGQEVFFSHQNDHLPLIATDMNSMDVESADVDGDGDLDLIVAGEYSRSLLMFNDGTGDFSEDPSRLLPERNTGDSWSGEDSEDIATGDLDLDGDLDIVMITEDTQYHEILINDGNGLFEHTDEDLPSSMGNAVLLLDLNADEYLDIIVGNSGQNHVYINDQDLTFTAEPNRWPSNSEWTQDLKAVDLDNDGDMDIVEGIDVGSNNVLINEGGFFTEMNERLPAINGNVETRKISLGDINGDGHQDLFISTVNFMTGNDIQNLLYLNDGNGYFSDITWGHLPLYSQFTLDGVFLDYDIDGDVDLITCDFQNPNGNYHALENDGTGFFSFNTDEVFEEFVMTNGVGLHSADLNGDGYSDLYFANFAESDDLLFYDPTILNTDEEKVTETRTYPIPTSKELILEYSLNERALAHICDERGLLIKVVPLNAGTIHRIDLNDLAPGSYLVRVENENFRILKD